VEQLDKMPKTDVAELRVLNFN